MEKPIYRQLRDFMLAYTRDYSRYANDPETIQKMDSYWAPDFKVKAYFKTDSGKYPVVYNSRREFKDVLVATHQEVKDRMLVSDITIDPEARKAVILMKIEKTHLDSGAKTEIDAIGSYQLEVGSDYGIVMKSLDFFWQAPPEIRNLGY
jgi:hypothetical protein